jgi:hypothetical protein
LLCQFDVSLRCGLRLLLEGVEHINRIGQSSCKNNAVGTGVIPYSNFFNPFANRGHRLEVIRLHSVLYAVQLVADVPLHVMRELPKAIKGVTQKFDWLDGYKYIRIDINSKSVRLES